MARIRLNGVAKRYGRVVAIEKLDLEIRDREFMVLLGPSGCGKTTTLNVIAGLEELSAGSVAFDDREVTRLPAHKREIAMVFQSYALYPQKTVFENIAFGLRLRRLPGSEIESRVRAAAKELEIGDLLERRPHQLSGGQRQRVALGRALVRHPAAFLMDEPLSNLDAALRGSMRVLIKKLHGTMGTTFVYVTHDQAEAMMLADRIAVMRAGAILQIDTPDGIYERPANRFVAGFLGAPQMNFIDGELSAGAGGLEFACSGLRLPIAAGDSRRQGRKVTLGLRPEDVTVGGNAAASIRGRVALVSPLGSEQYVSVAISGGEIVVRLPKATRVAAGDCLDLGVDPDRLHVFDQTTGQSLGSFSQA
jgi:multiple sugar transport system ATP-binding protein